MNFDAIQSLWVDRRRRYLIVFSVLAVAALVQSLFETLYPAAMIDYYELGNAVTPARMRFTGGAGLMSAVLIVGVTWCSFLRESLVSTRCFGTIAILSFVGTFGGITLACIPIALISSGLFVTSLDWQSVYQKLTQFG